MSTAGFVDTWILYPSTSKRGYWIAHSVNTDQIGMGASVLNAYLELHKAMDILLAEAKKHKMADIIHPAPQEILDKLAHARPLPKKIVDIATMKLRGVKKALPRYKAPYGGKCQSLKVTPILEVA